MKNLTHSPLTAEGGSDQCLVRFVEAIGRNDGEERQHSHLYIINEDGSMLPMCRKGWNRSDGEGFSIFRGYRGAKGLCKTCEKRKAAGLRGVEAQPGSHKTKWI